MLDDFDKSKKIGIIDAELLSDKKRTFPNLACMKISSYYKSLGYEIKLITMEPRIRYMYNTNSGGIVASQLRKEFSHVFVSKVFIKTQIPTMLLDMEIVSYGGTGFYYSDSPDLPPQIEHMMPDYHLYDEWVKEQIKEGRTQYELKYFNSASIGYMTRGCFRKCSFCVNKKYSSVCKSANSVKEFFNENYPYVCLLDDNILGYKDWRSIFKELNSTGKKFEFIQGLDIRLLDEEKIEVLLSSNYEKNSLVFAFDSIEEKDIIIPKMELWRKHYTESTSMYILCGYDKNNIYDHSFWLKDILDTLKRIRICMEYGFLPYIMRYEKYKLSPYYGIYVILASWCNQKSIFIKKSLRESCEALQDAISKKFESDKIYSSMKYIIEFENKHPEITKEYFDLKYEEVAKYQYTKGKTKYRSSKRNRRIIIEPAIKNQPFIEKEIVKTDPLDMVDYKQWFKDVKFSNIDNGVLLENTITAMNSIVPTSASLVMYNIKDNLEKRYLDWWNKCTTYINSGGRIAITFKNNEVIDIVSKGIKNTGMYVINGIYREKEEFVKFMILSKSSCETLKLKSIYKDKQSFFKDLLPQILKENDLIINLFNNYDLINKLLVDIHVNMISVRNKRGQKNYHKTKPKQFTQINMEIS